MNGTSALYVGLDTLYPRLFAAAPGLPETAAEAYLRTAAIAFCERSGWLEREVRMPTACDVRDYPIVPDACERVVRVRRVWLGVHPYQDGGDPGLGFDVEALESPIVSIYLRHAPDGSEPVNIRYCAAPRESACVVDARLIEEWGTALIHRALSDLCLLPGQKFSDPRLGSYYATLFNEAIATARVRRITGRRSGRAGVTVMDTGEGPVV